ncbi:hypothetical protein HO173_008844 [Letharia columbiana]|uniref:Flavin reductase like domain-containing protein n=1 Tax=Letharia columbiana TaxID=112416 RepID=A0A8H6FQK2_9LECA|nr:uncharacterized protein HO173_008844 [Letharia columbiana]KAF6232881.1 hypothetical protein HO173_008844 [Letharia columbiana]
MPTNFGDKEQREEDPSGHEQRFDQEKAVKRNPHPDFNKVEASRPDWAERSEWHFTKTKRPGWKLGQGANDGGGSLQKKHVEINPYEEGRPAVFNYKLLISGIIPRPIGFVSTRSEDGSSTNLAPFSYTNVINHDPPLFTIGFAGGFSNAKDTLRNLEATKECTINIISEHYIEAANATSINAPYGTSEWSLSGLTPAPCTEVKPSRVKEAIFSIEGKLLSTTEFESRATPGKKTGVLAVVEGVRFWVREDAINEDRNIIDPGVLRPISRLGGIMYGRTVEGCEIPRPDFADKEKEGETTGLLKPKRENQ